jgi:hypothetical protein
VVPPNESLQIPLPIAVEGGNCTWSPTTGMHRALPQASYHAVPQDHDDDAILSQ